jgi:hypothetical protein
LTAAQTLTLPSDGRPAHAGMGDFSLLTPDGRHRVDLPYCGEPPHGDSFHTISVDGVGVPGNAWGCGFACSSDSRFLCLSWMEKRYDRKTLVIDLMERRYFALPFYISNFMIRWPVIEGVGMAEGLNYSFCGSENWTNF